MLDLGNLRIGITVDSAGAKQELNSVGDAVEGTGSKWSKFGKLATGVAVATATAITAFAVSATKDFLETADHIDKMSQKLGISAEAYQEWDYVMGHAGTDIDSFNRSMKTMRKNLQDGSDAFNKLGIATKDAEGNLRSDEEVMRDTILALADMEDTTQRNALAQEIWGNSYTEMLPLLNEGSEAIEQQLQDVHDLGLVIDGEAVSAGAHLGDTLADIKSVLGTLGTQLAIQLLPYIQEIADFVLTHSDEINLVISGIGYVLGGLIQLIAKIVEEVIVGIATAKQNIESAWQSITWLVEQIKSIAPVLWNAGKDAINKFLDGIKNAWNNVKGWIEDKVNWVKEKFSGIGNLIGGITGTHRTGLREVPYDGYIAELHKGEMVLTAPEANAYQNRASGTQSVSNITVNNYSPKALTEAETARQFRKTQRRLELGFGG